MQDGENRLLAEILPLAPRGLAAEAVVAVDVDVEAEERIGTLRRREALGAPNLSYVDPTIVLPRRILVAIVEEAGTLHVEGLAEREQHLLVRDAGGIRAQVGLGSTYRRLTYQSRR